MEVIYELRRVGKTRELIKRSSEYNYVIVCDKPREVKLFSFGLGIRIPQPLSYQDFIERKYTGAKIKGFLIDNVGMLVQFMAQNIPVDTITLRKELPFYI